jgi:hypothetical protein
MCSFRLGSFLRIQLEVIFHVDTADYKNVTFFLDLPPRVGNQATFASWDAARLQRASKGAGQSTCRCSHHVIERCRVRLVDGWIDFVVLRHF